MPIERFNFDDVSEEDLRNLIQGLVPEGLTIEYKREAYGNSDAQKKEALKDITSFANSAGGHLIIGMEETNGVPTGVPGLHNVDPDALISRLESLVRDGIEPRVVGIRMRRVNLSIGTAAIVIRVPRSWNPPHRVSAANTNRFYVRNSAGVHEASVEELRVLFTLSTNAEERIKAFRSDRISQIAAGHGPVLLPPNGRLIVHLVPLSAFGQVSQIDLQSAYEIHAQFRPMAAMGMTPKFNLDGVINIRGGETCHGYTQVFRNGIVEATKASVLRGFSGENILHAGSTTDNIVEVIPSYFEGLRTLDVPTPIVIMVSYQGVKGAKLGLRNYDHRLGEISSFPRFDPLLLPEVIINDYGSPSHYVCAIRPIFDALWNAAGFSRCTYYDAHGEWNPPG